MDDKIPEFSFNEINQDQFGLCFAGSVDQDRDHYLLYPTTSSPVSNQILVTNYEEDNFSIYRIPLSTIGNFIGAFDVTWDDLAIYNTWDEMAAVYGNWNAFSFSKGAPFSVGGGHQGQIVKLNSQESIDYPVKIRDMTVIDAMTLQITTDYQTFQNGQIVKLDGIQGMVQANDKQGVVSQLSPTDPYTFNLIIRTTGFASYTGGGTAAQVIEFNSKTKKFNPFANQAQKVRCGWVYFYVSTSNTELTVNQNITNITTNDLNQCVVTVPANGYPNNQQVFIDGVLGMTELNRSYYYITVIDADNFILNGVDSSGYTPYTSGGFASIPDTAKLLVRVIVNDTESQTEVNTYDPTPYEINLTSGQPSNGIKKWYKLWINQTGNFLQLQFSNAQAGVKIQIHAVMPGFAPVGRLI